MSKYTAKQRAGIYRRAAKIVSNATFDLGISWAIYSLGAYPYSLHEIEPWIMQSRYMRSKYINREMKILGLLFAEQIALDSK